MNTEAYIASGILELYVTGSLSEQEAREVAIMAKNNPEIANQVAKIEAALIALAKATAPVNTPPAPKIIGRASNAGRPTRWLNYTGWAAAVLATAGLVNYYYKTDELNNTVQDLKLEQQFVQQELKMQQETLVATQNLLDALRDKNTVKVALPGQANYAESYAAIFWNKETETLYLDANGLPEAPEGMQYQLWSLKLDPLTPTSLGVLDAESTDLSLYTIANPNESEAFGITLEPEGGSESPTLERLYVLGAVSTP